MNASLEKDLLRRPLRERCKALDCGWRLEASRAICGFLCDDALWSGVTRIGVFSGDAGEPDLSDFIEWAGRNGKKLYLPRFNRQTGEYDMVGIDDFASQLTEGRYRIQEPLPGLPAAAAPTCENGMDFLVPGVGFDGRGNRLGRGKGYFDRLLAPCAGRKIGVFFQFQKLDAIPAEPHDRRLDLVVTEQGLSIF